MEEIDMQSPAELAAWPGGAVWPSLVTYLRAQHVAIADQTQHIVSNLSYAGDEGGIVCHIAPPDKEEALVVSLTQVRVPRSMPLAAAVADNRNHRVTTLKTQRTA